MASGNSPVNQPKRIGLAAVSVHRSLTMRKRYYLPSAADLAKKIG